MTTCIINDCNRPAGLPGTARGMCHSHYRRWQRHGDPLAGQHQRIKGDALARLMARLDRTGECWLWTGAVFKATGYGAFNRGRGMEGVHRVAYELLVGTIPEGLQLDHLCRVRHCVNPDHLEPVTAQENQLRGVAVRHANRAAR